MASHYYPGQFYYPTPYLYPYYHQPYTSPFIPPAPLPASPEPPRRQVHFEDDPPRSDRRRSWAAPTAPPPNAAPFPSPPLLYTALPSMYPIAPPVNLNHHRTRSDGNLPQPAWFAVPTYPPFMAPYTYQPAPPAPQLHPLLNGESREAPLLLFDLSFHTFKPVRISEQGRTNGNTLTSDELGQHATHPGIKRMKITCDLIPQWPIVLEPRERERSNYLSVPSGSQDAPITLGDVLVAIHRSLQLQISHVDWARLSQQEETAVARAYTRRCKTFPSVEDFEKSQGVRRVDYLLDKFMFKGLVRSSAGQEGYENVRLLLGRK